MNFKEWINFNTPLNEYANATRYSVEVNYRTNSDEMLDGFAKISLGYISAALKQNKFHVRHVFDETPIRILISSRNWDDGEWVCVVSYNNKERCFIISKGFYNKDRKTVSIQDSKKCDGKSAADITKEVRNTMHVLKDKKDRHKEPLKGVPLKRGPK